MTNQKQAVADSAVRAEQILIEKYFNDSEIKTAKTAIDPVEFLRKSAVESRRGRGLGNGVYFETMTGGLVEIYVAPDGLGKTEPTLRMPVKKLAQKVVEHFTEPPGQVVEIEVSRIVPSPFKSQARRRARFKDEEIKSLSESILLHGLAQPILVRGIGRKFEIVFGERRFLAVKKPARH